MFCSGVSSETNWVVSNFNSHVGGWCPCCSAGVRDTAEKYQQTDQQFHNQNKINILITDSKLLPTSKTLSPCFQGVIMFSARLDISGFFGHRDMLTRMLTTYQGDKVSDILIYLVVFCAAL